MKQSILGCLSSLPSKILSLSTHDNLTEFVLHELCSENCFNIQKAAYFVDNPDFDCLKGVAGFYKTEAYPSQDIWQQPELFSTHMKHSPFNQKVRTIQHSSMTKDAANKANLLNVLSEELGIARPHCCTIHMRYDNHGILLVEESPDAPVNDDLLTNGLGILGFCPIF